MEAPACAYAMDLTLMVMENVEVVLRHNGGQTMQKLETVFNRMDYDVIHYSFDARSCIVPVHKPRIFIFAVRKDISELIHPV